MAEQKRDYYEVLGVDRNADEAALKKHTGSSPKNTILTPIPATKKQKRNSRRLPRHTPFSAIRRKDASTISSAMRHSMAVRAAASADLISAALILVIFLATYSETFSEAVPAEEAGREMRR